MSDLYEVITQGEALPIAVNVPEDEAYALNLRMSALAALYDSLKGGIYRSNPEGRAAEGIEEELRAILRVDELPTTFAGAKKALKQSVKDKKTLGGLNAELASLYSELNSLRSKQFTVDMVESLLGEYSKKFGVVLNQGTLASVLSTRASDFEEYFTGEKLGFRDLKEADAKYVEDLLFMLEAFRNITDAASSDIDDRFYTALGLFNKKTLRAVVNAINFCETREGDATVDKPREYDEIVGGHYSPAFFLIIYCISRHNRKGFIKWLESDALRSIRKSKSVITAFEEAMRVKGEGQPRNLGQGQAGDGWISKICADYQGVTDFQIGLFLAAESCIFGGGKYGEVKKGLDFANPSQVRDLLKSLTSANIGYENADLTSSVVMTFKVAFAMSKISNELPDLRDINVYDDNNEKIIKVIQTQDPSPLGRFYGKLREVKTATDIVKTISRFTVVSPPLVPRDIRSFYFATEFTSDDLADILPEDIKPTIRNLSYMRWMSHLYTVSNASRSWGTASVDKVSTERLLLNKSFDQDVSAMLYHIREQRRNGNLDYKRIIDLNSSTENPFLCEYNTGFDYSSFDNGHSSRSHPFADEFTDALANTDHYDAFVALFPSQHLVAPSAIGFGFLGAVLSPHVATKEDGSFRKDNFNDVRSYKCELLPHGDIEMSTIEVWQTSAFNPVSIVTGHTQLSNCCMYPKAQGPSASFSDFLHGDGISTMFVFDVLAKNKGNKAYFLQDGDVVCLGTVYNASTYPTLNDTSKVSSVYALKMIEGDTSLYLQYNEPVPYKLDAQGNFLTAVSTLDGWEYNNGDTSLVDQATLGYDFKEVGKRAVYKAIDAHPELNYLISGVYDFSSPDALLESASDAGISWSTGNNSVYTDGRQAYREVRTGFFGSRQVSNASSAFSTMVVSFDKEGENAIVGYLNLDDEEMPQIEVSWDYLRYMFSFPMGHAFVPFEGSVIFDASPRNKSVCLELLTPSWFESANEKPLIRGENSYNQADLIAMRTPQRGAFIGREQIL